MIFKHAADQNLWIVNSTIYASVLHVVTVLSTNNNRLDEYRILHNLEI